VTGRNTFMASSAGGMDIEKVAEETPELILKETIDPSVGLRPFQARKLAFGLGIPSDLINQAAKFMLSLYDAYEKMDASLVEINPFLLTKDNRLIALDAKVNFDDNAMFRHKDYADLRDLDEEEPLEIEASKFDLNYIKLDGNIGCMVNGAGLAMATMDIIKLHGGEPANFLDVGGGASQERVEQAFRILLSDTNVKAVLVNIFGGIVRTDMVANGVVAAAKNLGVSIPIIARLEGTNVEEGRRILAESGIGISEDKQDQIFEQFRQADVKTTRKYGGTGLGLTISQKLVKLMGGELKVESKTNLGSRFYFQLPKRKIVILAIC